MNRIVRAVLYCIAFGSFIGIVVVATRDHVSVHPVRVSVVTTVDPNATDFNAGGTDDQPAGITTVTLASPQRPLSSADPGSGGSGIGAGKPASFWLLTIAYPTSCTPGTVVEPVLSWNAANTNTVAVSVDAPATVGGYGFFESINTLTMPKITCVGVKGDPLPTHEYEIDAFGTDNTRLHVEVDVNIKVGASNAQQAA